MQIAWRYIALGAVILGSRSAVLAVFSVLSRANLVLIVGLNAPLLAHHAPANGVSSLRYRRSKGLVKRQSPLP